jgi:hypothetical protein
MQDVSVQKQLETLVVSSLAEYNVSPLSIIHGEYTLSTKSC